MSKLVYSFMGAKTTGITPVCRLMCGDGPYDWMADQVVAFAKANRKPLIIARCDPQVKPTAERVPSTAELAYAFGDMARHLKRRNVKIRAIVDSADYVRTPETDDRYYMGTIRPFADIDSALEWCNYGTLPGTMLGDLQTMYAPVEYLFDGFDPLPPGSPPRTPEQVVELKRSQYAMCAATGKTVIPFVGSMLVARKDIPLPIWQSHLREVLATNDTTIIFDQTGEADDKRKRPFDEGKVARSTAVKFINELKAAA